MSRYGPVNHDKRNFVFSGVSCYRLDINLLLFYTLFLHYHCVLLFVSDCAAGISAEMQVFLIYNFNTVYFKS